MQGRPSPSRLAEKVSQRAGHPTYDREGSLRAGQRLGEGEEFDIRAGLVALTFV